MLKIESAQNDRFRIFASLTSSKGLKAEGLFLLSGEKLVREFLAKPNLKIAAEIIGPGMKPLTSGDVFELVASLFNEVDAVGTHFNILVLPQPDVKTLSPDEFKNYQPRGIEVVTPIGDPSNLGALIRSCEAFGVPRVILTQEAANPFLPKAVKASAGSVLRVPMLRASALKDCPQGAIALDMEGTSVDEFAWPSNGLLVLGEEGQGLDAKSFKHRVRIPTQGVDSLNVTVAASIALAAKARKTH